MYKYLSTAWIVLRGTWLFNIVGEIFKLVVLERSWSLSKIAKEAYKLKLAHHHPWPIQKLVVIGFSAVTSREKFQRAYLKEK